MKKQELKQNNQKEKFFVDNGELTCEDETNNHKDNFLSLDKMTYEKYITTKSCPYCGSDKLISQISEPEDRTKCRNCDKQIDQSLIKRNKWIRFEDVKSSMKSNMLFDSQGRKVGAIHYDGMNDDMNNLVN